jgi:hypothetical protein
MDKVIQRILALDESIETGRGLGRVVQVSPEARMGAHLGMVLVELGGKCVSFTVAELAQHDRTLLPPGAPALA